MIQSSALFGRTLREMCGEYNPNSESEDTKFHLDVGEKKVPVFITKVGKARYPEIRVYPFWDETSYYGGRAYDYSPGVKDAGEYEDLMYKRSRTDTTVRNIRSVIEIYGKSTLETLSIRDALFERIERFRLAEIAYFRDSENWVESEDENVYINPKYDTETGIVKIYDSSDKLIKTPNVLEEEGSWFITKNGLQAHPLSSLENLEMGVVYNGGHAFYNGDLLASRGIMSFKVVKSSRDQQKGPDVPNWSLHTVTSLKDVIVFDVGKSYSKVNVNEKRKY